MRLSYVLTCVLAAASLCAGEDLTGAGVPFGRAPGGIPVQLFTLKNATGMEARVMTWGATLVSLKVPDASGQPGNIVLGFDDLAGYLSHTAFFGAVVGRYGNRIGKARFTLDGKVYKLFRNSGENTLHGGQRGFDKRVWTAVQADQHSVELQYKSKAGEEGYPGNLTATVRYTLTPDNELRLDYTAITDQDTVVNLTNHSYFNLGGAGNGVILAEDIRIDADRFTPVDAGLIPTGELRKVAGTPMDFRRPTAIGARIDASYEQLKFGPGYDHNWVLNRSGDGLTLAARVHDARTGRVMEVLTTEPGVQFYTANMLVGPVKGRDGKIYQRRGALCLETQHFPDSPNKPAFPSTELKPGETYRSSTVYRFSVQK